jgi:hypothetical protein
VGIREKQQKIREKKESKGNSPSYFFSSVIDAVLLELKQGAQKEREAESSETSFSERVSHPVFFFRR